MPEYRMQRFRGGWAIAEYEGGKRISRHRLEGRDPGSAAAEFQRIVTAAKRPVAPDVAALWNAYREDRKGRRMVWKIHSIIFRDDETGDDYRWELPALCHLAESLYGHNRDGTEPPADCPPLGAQEPHDRPDAGDGAAASSTAEGTASDPLRVRWPTKRKRNAASAAISTSRPGNSRT
jgi:hypothetical protein